MIFSAVSESGGTLAWSMTAVKSLQQVGSSLADLNFQRVNIIQSILLGFLKTKSFTVEEIDIIIKLKNSLTGNLQASAYRYIFPIYLPLSSTIKLPEKE